MPRIAGTDIAGHKQIWVGLTSIYGIGPKLSRDVLKELGIAPETRSKDLTDDEVSKIAALLQDRYVIEGHLRRQETQNIARLRNIRCYRGLRHRLGLPVRGQRTRTNARTRKGKKKTVAGRKSVKEMR